MSLSCLVTFNRVSLLDSGVERCVFPPHNTALSVPGSVRHLMHQINVAPHQLGPFFTHYFQVHIPAGLLDCYYIHLEKLQFGLFLASYNTTGSISVL